MPLLDLLRDSPAAVNDFTIEQAVAMAGDGVLRDNSDCSHELREYLSRISSDKLFNHVDYCLSSSFSRSGFVLQDIVNELGKRLGYDVEFGIYKGRSNTNNFDGIWKESSGSYIVVEVKTSDAYRINLDNVASYRDRLIQESIITNKSSILLVVGRQDTGDLEAQIRGSKHAWDTRVISAEALINLVKIKESADEDITITKIRSLLAPFEYTRLDNIVDIMFTTTQDVEASLELDSQSSEFNTLTPDAQIPKQLTPRKEMDELRKRVISSLAEREKINLIAHKRTQYWTPDHKIRAVCTTSKRYDKSYNYWYAYHTKWHKYLRDGNSGYFVLGCLDKNSAYVLPYSEISGILTDLNTTTPPNKDTYWHIHLEDNHETGMALILRGEGRRKSMAEFEMRLI